MGVSGCAVFSYEDYEPTMRVELSVHACGAPSWDGSNARLVPTTAGSVDASWRVPSTIVVPGPILTDDQRVGADGLTNGQNLFVLGSRLSSPFTCVTAELVRGQARRQTAATESAGCMVITAKDSRTVTVDPPNGDPVTLNRSSRDGLNAVPINDPAILRLYVVRGALDSQVLGDC